MFCRKFFWVGVGLLIIVSALDLVITWMGTPTLENEGNAFVEQFGFGWIELILLSIGLICFVSIPFYYHCLVFDYPRFEGGRKMSFKYLSYYLFKNHTKIPIAIARAAFSILGYYLFCWLFITKASAVVHNLLMTTGSGFSKLTFSGRMRILNTIDNSLLLLLMILFLVSIMYSPMRKRESTPARNSMHFSIIVIFFLLYASFEIFVRFSEKTHIVSLTGKADPDIVLINIGEADRASIAKLIKSVDSCRPAVVAINVLFEDERNDISDSLLVSSLKQANNDFLSYLRDEYDTERRSNVIFRNLVEGEGLVFRQKTRGVITKFVPWEIRDDIDRESLALKIVNFWKPELETTIRPNKPLRIQFARTSEQFLKFEASNFSAKESGEFIKGKVVLIGYLGPRNEDKYFTPIRYVKMFSQKEPDTYGIVILANEIRTIMNTEEND